MVIVRLARGGSKKRPFFNIHVCDSRTRRDGRFIERLGYYNPVAAGQATRLVVDLERPCLLAVQWRSALRYGCSSREGIQGSARR